MSDIEVIESTLRYQVFTHHVRVPGGSYHDWYRDVEVPGIDVIQSIEFGRQDLAENLAWVDLARQAVLKIRHPSDELMSPDRRVYGIPDYPIETLYGSRVLYSESLLVTDRTGQSFEFTPVSKIVESEKLTPYTARWLGAVANSNNHPAFLHKLQHLLPKSALANNSEDFF